jgi:hypothetical protein
MIHKNLGEGKDFLSKGLLASYKLIKNEIFQ